MSEYNQGVYLSSCDEINSPYLRGQIDNVSIEFAGRFKNGLRNRFEASSWDDRLKQIETYLGWSVMHAKEDRILHGGSSSGSSEVDSFNAKFARVRSLDLITHIYTGIIDPVRTSKTVMERVLPLLQRVDHRISNQIDAHLLVLRTEHDQTSSSIMLEEWVPRIDIYSKHILDKDPGKPFMAVGEAVVYELKPCDYSRTLTFFNTGKLSRVS